MFVAVAYADPGGPALCAPTGNETIATDREDYGPGETVEMTGSGYGAGCGVTVKVTRPNGSVVVGDGSFAPGSDTVVTNASGDLYYLYQLNGIMGQYLVEAIGEDGAVLATTSFSDALDFQIPNVDLTPSFVKKVDGATAATENFSLLVEQDSPVNDAASTIKCIRVQLPTENPTPSPGGVRWIVNSASLAISSGGAPWTTSISNPNPVTQPTGAASPFVKFTSSTGLVGGTPGYARIEINATTNPPDGQRQWTVFVSSDASNTAAGSACAGTNQQLDPLAGWDDQVKSTARVYTADFRDGSNATTTPSVPVGGTDTFRVRFTSTGTGTSGDSRIRYATISVPPCFGSISAPTLTTSPVASWTASVVGNVIRLKTTGTATTDGAQNHGPSMLQRRRPSTPRDRRAPSAPRHGPPRVRRVSSWAERALDAKHAAGARTATGCSRLPRVTRR